MPISISIIIITIKKRLSVIFFVRHPNIRWRFVCPSVRCSARGSASRSPPLARRFHLFPSPPPSHSARPPPPPHPRVPPSPPTPPSPSPPPCCRPCALPALDSTGRRRPLHRADPTPRRYLRTLGRLGRRLTPLRPAPSPVRATPAPRRGSAPPAPTQPAPSRPPCRSRCAVPAAAPSRGPRCRRNIRVAARSRPP